MRDDGGGNQRTESVNGEQSCGKVLRARWVKCKANLDHVLHNWNDEAVQNFL